MLYPQNGNRIVTIDYVTSLHPICSNCVNCLFAYASMVCLFKADTRREIFCNICIVLSAFTGHAMCMGYEAGTNGPGKMHGLKLVEIPTAHFLLFAFLVPFFAPSFAPCLLLFPSLPTSPSFNGSRGDGIGQRSESKARYEAEIM